MLLVGIAARGLASPVAFAPPLVLPYLKNKAASLHGDVALQMSRNKRRGSILDSLAMGVSPGLDQHWHARRPE